MIYAEITTAREKDFIQLLEKSKELFFSTAQKTPGPLEFEFSAFRTEVKKRLFCSRICANKGNAIKNSLSKIGEKNPCFGKRPWNYIDGKSGGRKVDMRYWIWRRKVFNRDKNICQNCFIKFKRKKLTAHHIKSWKDYPELRLEVNNGQTLCRSCHNKIDKNIKKNHYGKRS